MPIGYPPDAVDGDLYPALAPKWRYDGFKWNPLSSYGAATPIVDRLLTVVGTTDFIAIDNSDGGKPKLVSATALADSIGGTITATEPAAFTIGMWTLSAIVGGLRFGITSLPSDGGSAITALQYRLNGGAWTAFSGSIVGDYDITGLPATLHTAEIRAVNIIGAALTASDTKSATPTASGGSATLVASEQDAPDFSTTVIISVPGTAVAGDRLLVMFSSGTAVTSAVDSEGGVLSALTIGSAGVNDQVFMGNALGSTIPTTVTLTFASSVYIKSDIRVLRGVSNVVGTHGAWPSDGYSNLPRDHSYTTTADNQTVFGQIDFDGGGVNGASGQDANHVWLLSDGSGFGHTFGAVRATAGTYVATIGPVGASSNSAGYWFALNAA